jgi:hypothetical protein
VIWAGLGQNFMAAQQAGLKTQACQLNLFAIYTGRNQNSINIKAWVLVVPWFVDLPSIPRQNNGKKRQFLELDSSH